jgi:hypothetical protein
MKLFVHRSSRRGMVLVVVLAILVLVTAAVLAFFSQAAANRSVEASRSHRTNAALVGRSAADYTVGKFLGEITSSTNSRVVDSGDVRVYLARSATNAVPARIVSSPLAGDTNAFALIRQSLPTADANASSHNTGAAARGGRRISPERWNAPKLLAGSGFTNTNQTPFWIYLDPHGGVSAKPTATAIGRFAYNVYEVGGLLNVNVAGYPTGMNRDQIAALKTSQAGADLSLLGLTPSGIDDLVKFRNPGAATPNDYQKTVEAGIPEGFLSNVVSKAGFGATNNFITSRQDLLRYVSLKNPALTNALPYLTHFSRSLNAPSWTPVNPAGTSVNYEMAADNAASPNRNLPNVRFPSAGTVKHYADDGSVVSRSVRAGDPLLERRFSLARLAWLTPEGPSASLSPSHPQYHPGGTAAAIADVFGLQWVPARGRWEYIGHGGFSGPLKTLEEVAAEHREPDFFETLKAGILSGSLGLASASSPALVGASGVQAAVDGLPDAQIVKIGANLIDSADADNYPTIIFFKLDSSGFGVELPGLEDLPYLHGIDSVILNDITTAEKKVNQLDLVWTPVLFNPHSASSGAPISGPANVSVSLDKGILTSISYLGPALSATGLTHPMGGQRFVVGSSGFRDAPGVVTAAGDPQSLGALVPYATGNTDVLTFRMFSFGVNAPAKLPHTYAEGASLSLVRTVMSNVQITLKYTTPGGVEKIYARLGGYDDGAGTIDMGTLYADNNSGAANRKSLNATYYSKLWDPRSVRLGTSMGWTRSSAVSLPNPDTDAIRTRDPFNWNDNTFLYWGKWPQGDKDGGYAGAPRAPYENMRDPDQVTRPADGWLDSSGSANLYRNLSDSLRRPVILQRPFRSVAEMGYVFRDSPWKTLSFFDETSGDGALLDLFSVQDEPVVTAGRVNLNTAPAPVIASLLSGGTMADDLTTLTPASASQIAGAFQDRVRPDLQASANTLRSPAGIPNFLSSTEFAGSASLRPLKFVREAVPRSLADVAQTRTWNLLIDVIAQAGRFGKAGTSASDFIVEAESRYWLSIAIDRFTGQIVEQQLEQVSE